MKKIKLVFGMYILCNGLNAQPFNLTKINEAEEVTLLLDGHNGNYSSANMALGYEIFNHTSLTNPLLLETEQSELISGINLEGEDDKLCWEKKASFEWELYTPLYAYNISAIETELPSGFVCFVLTVTKYADGLYQETLSVNNYNFAEGYVNWHDSFSKDIFSLPEPLHFNLSGASLVNGDTCITTKVKLFQMPQSIGSFNYESNCFEQSFEGSVTLPNNTDVSFNNVAVILNKSKTLYKYKRYLCFLKFPRKPPKALYQTLTASIQ